MLAPTGIDEVVAVVREHPGVVPHGALTKAPLVAEGADAVRVDMTALSGIREYEPDEFTFTALAGTPLTEVVALLASHGQRMPFDPPLPEQGATIGGTLAAGLNGSGRLRYGGLRDFVLGVRFVDGTGALVRGGGKVVKNAAGFDLPKLMVGSMGRLGVIVEVTFKVFPAPAAWRTVRVRCRDVRDAVSCVVELGRMPLELEALDLEPPGTLMVRVSGDDDALDAHASRVGMATQRPYELLAGVADSDYWRAQRAFTWLEPGQWLLKVPLTPRRIEDLERAVDPQEVPRRYGVAGNVAWLAWPADRPFAELDLAGLGGLAVRGPPLNGTSPRVGETGTAAGVFADRVKAALDPQRRLPALV